MPEIDSTEATIHRIAELIRRHRYAQAQQVISALAERRRPEHRFEGIDSEGDLPLAYLESYSEVSVRVLSALDEAGVCDLGTLRQTPTRCLTELPRTSLTPQAINAVRVAAQQLVTNYRRWKAKREGREADQC